MKTEVTLTDVKPDGSLSLCFSSGGLYHVTLGTLSNIFMSPTRNAAPSEVSILISTSFLGDVFPAEIVSHTSNPSTGFG